MIAHVRGLPWQNKRRLCDIQDALHLSREQMHDTMNSKYVDPVCHIVLFRLSVVDEILHREPYTQEELIKILGVSVKHTFK